MLNAFKPHSANKSRQRDAVRFVEIPSPGQAPAHGGVTAPFPIEEFTLEQLHDRLRDAGVAADRVSSPNLLAQLKACIAKPPAVLMCCAVDSDPELPLNAVVAAAYQSDLVAGMTTLAKATKASRILLAADHETLASPLPTSIGKIPLRSGYPLTDPTILLYSALGKQLKPRALPTDVGVLLIDAPQAIAIRKWLNDGRQVTHVPLLVRDHRARRSHYVLAPVGATFSYLLQHLSIPAEDVTLRIGDLLRDFQLLPETAITNGEVVLHITDLERADNPDSCIRCGWCVESCPTRIHPAGLLEAAQQEDPIMAERYGLRSCIECGICSYVCPSRLPLLSGIRTLSARFASRDDKS